MSKVLVVGDIHAPGMLPSYPAFLSRIHEKHSCNKVIFIGDVVDWAAISFHEKNPNLPGAKRERYKAQKQVDKLYERFPKADWLIGNHDALPQRNSSAAGNPEDVLVPYNQYWGVPGWVAHPRFTRLVHDGVIYCHGDSGKGGQFAAPKNSRDNWQSWVSGHCHSEAGVWYTTVEGEDKRIFGMNVGCGINRDLLMFNYGRKFNKKPTLGCGVVINGKQAYFEPM